MPLILVRHAVTDWTGHRYAGRRDPPLSPDGLAQAVELARTLSPDLLPGSAIISSSAQRARQTAVALAATVPGAALTVDDRWLEADMGRAEGLTFDELAALDAALAERLAAGDPAIDWPDGETAASLAARVGDALASVTVRTHRGETVVVVSHAGPLRLAIAAVRGVEAGAVELPAPASWVVLEPS